ncbi:MAG: hypothetical protein ABNH53_15700 [Henriciella sp.]
MKRTLTALIVGGALLPLSGFSSMAQGGQVAKDNLPKCKMSGRITEDWSGEVYLFGDNMAWITGIYNEVDITLEDISLDPGFRPNLMLQFRIDADGSIGNTFGTLQLGTATGVSGQFVTNWRFTYSLGEFQEAFDPINMNLPSVCSPVCSRVGVTLAGVTRENLRAQVAVPFSGEGYNLKTPNEKFFATADLSAWPEVHDQLIIAYQQLQSTLEAGKCDRSS